MIDTHPDVVVIGAGAAGLGAARTAADLGLAPLVLEAKARPGGRAHTDTAALGVPWDRGAHWLHAAANNPFTRFAEHEGFACERAPAPGRLWRDGGFDPEAHAEARQYYARAFAAIEAAGARGLDVAAAEVIPDHARFRAMFDAWFAALAGVEPERMSTLDYWRYDESGGNYRVAAGYGALVAHYGEGLPVRLGTTVERVRWNGSGVVVETDRGDVHAPAVIVTVSTNVLAAGGIAFEPALPAWKQDAIATVPVGEANKVALAFDRDVFDAPEPYHLHFEHATRATVRFEICPFGRNVAIGYLGGRFAAEMEAAGREAMADLALEQLIAVFGSDLRRRLLAVDSTAWCGDPHIQGGYSCARPGQAHQRSRLAEPLAERVFFAGEACSITGFGAVHGAHASGVAAARAVARLRGGPDAGGIG